MDHSLTINTLSEIESLVASNLHLYLEGPNALHISL